MTIVRKDNTVIHSLADLKGKRIGVQLGTTGAQEAEKIEGAKVTNFDTSDLACLELKTAMWTPLSVTCRYWSFSLKGRRFLRKDRWNPEKG